jgi:hypothetical protein
VNTANGCRARVYVRGPANAIGDGGAWEVGEHARRMAAAWMRGALGVQRAGGSPCWAFRSAMSDHTVSTGPPALRESMAGGLEGGPFRLGAIFCLRSTGKGAGLSVVQR